jgi:hypothetical protein
VPADRAHRQIHDSEPGLFERGGRDLAEEPFRESTEGVAQRHVELGQPAVQLG